MTRCRLVHEPTESVMAMVIRADNWLAKGWGVLGRRSLPPGEGLWLPGVASVHTVGVRFALDVLFLDAEMRTVRVALNVPPGRWLVRASGAAHTLELGAGTLAAAAAALQNGDDWRVEEELPRFQLPASLTCLRNVQPGCRVEEGGNAAGSGGV